MKILFTAKGKKWDSLIDSRFGRTDFFFIYDEDKDEIEIYDNRSTANEAHGVGPKTAQKVSKYKPDVIITGNGPGGNARRILNEGDYEVFVGAGNLTIKEAYEKYKHNELDKF